MRVRAWLLIGAFGLLLVPPLRAQAPPACPGPADVCAFLTTFLSALNRRDWDAFRGTFAEDITVIFDRPGPPQRQEGRAAVEAVFQNIFPAPGSPPGPTATPVLPDSLMVQALGDVAVVSFHVRHADQLGRRTLVFHRTADGWKVVHIHGSSAPLPPQ